MLFGLCDAHGVVILSDQRLFSIGYARQSIVLILPSSSLGLSHETECMTQITGLFECVASMVLIYPELTKRRSKTFEASVFVTLRMLFSTPIERVAAIAPKVQH